MSETPAEDRQAFWDAIYRGGVDTSPECGAGVAHPADWVREKIAGRPVPQRVLELGCGSGIVAEALHRDGHAVLATDISSEALTRLATRVPGLQTRRLDLQVTFPFESAQFDLVVADLCLHYFDAHTTTRIVAEIRRVLATDGRLLARVNSDRDTLYGAGVGDEIERGFYLHDGHYKRFFDEEMVRDFFADWEILALGRTETDRFGKPKRLFEMLATPRTTK